MHNNNYAIDYFKSYSCFQKRTTTNDLVSEFAGSPDNTKKYSDLFAIGVGNPKILYRFLFPIAW